MARRILSADSALTPPTQSSLETSVRTEKGGGFLSWLQERWRQTLSLPVGQVLFDWEDKTDLHNEIAFVNAARERIDEASLRIAPSMLRIVLTVKAHVAGPKAQRAFLSEHVAWDFRRISELCIVADSYGLLDPESRTQGERELRDYGWSAALKLAYVRAPRDRADIWERARGSKETAPYRNVLEEIRRFRERKLVGPPVADSEVSRRWSAARHTLAQLQTMPEPGADPELCRDALHQVNEMHRDLGRLKQALKERLDALETEELAATV